MPESLSKIIYRCLRKEIGQRYQHVGEIRAALEAIEQNTESKFSATARAVWARNRLRSARLRCCRWRIFRALPSKSILRMA